MQISERMEAGVLVIVASGRIDSNTAAALEAVLPDRVQEHDATVVDLDGVSYVSSAGLRVLLKGAKTAKSSGHRLVLTGLAPTVEEVFEISGFSTIFTIAPDLAGALAGLA